ncbi:hypothetical protein SBA5_110173 [Candidatus Sulfotelmatomonas gaucii]|uniref:Uncharacterized protein n=1 Tax=Candidatus Sulfuritelmatomonas gaucii TaxID=2043161 RepID=A0A2N9L3U3_9BACT|nr:hypothetical protein SBA5_110173 [Candidatus Sulfotelmatomonas gaucii]
MLVEFNGGLPSHSTLISHDNRFVIAPNLAAKFLIQLSHLLHFLHPSLRRWNRCDCFLPL